MRVAPGAYRLQPLRGWGLSLTFTPGFTWGYSYSTPSGLGPLSGAFPRFHLGLFIFNPYGVGAPPRPFPRFHLGLFIFNPYGVGASLPKDLIHSENRSLKTDH